MLFGSKNTAAEPTISGIAVLLEVTTGAPEAIASTSGFPKELVLRDTQKVEMDQNPLPRCLGLGADSLVVDLEDSVVDKVAGREKVGEC